MAYDIYTGLLKAFALPAEEKQGIHFSYDNNNPKFFALKSSYPIEKIAGDGDDFSKSKNLLKWVSRHIYHKGDYAGDIARNSIDLLDYAFDKDSAHGINCVCLSIILTECLLAVGLKARTVFIMPCSPYDGDNHVVTHVYVSEMKKWVMLDPTLNAYISNKKGEYLSLFELRNHLSNQEPVFFNHDAKYNDDEWTEESAKANIEYFAKNLFYFQTNEASTFGSAENSRFVTLCPQGYDPIKMRLSNIEYRIRKHGESPFMEKLLEDTKKEKCIFCSAADFEKMAGY